MPLTSKGKKIMKSMEKTYGSKDKAEEVFYASKNKGTIKDVDKAKKANLERVPKSRAYDLGRKSASLGGHVLGGAALGGGLGLARHLYRDDEDKDALDALKSVGLGAGLGALGGAGLHAGREFKSDYDDVMTPELRAYVEKQLGSGVGFLDVLRDPVVKNTIDTQLAAKRLSEF